MATPKKKPTAKATKATATKAPATKAATKPAAKPTEVKAAPKAKPAAKAASTTARKVPRSTANPGTKAAKVAAKATKPTTISHPRDTRDPHGFVPNTDTSLIAKALVEGGASRDEVNERAAELIKATNGIETRNGGTKNVPSLVAGVLGRLKAAGYTVESTFVVVPPKEIAEAMKKEAQAEKRRAARAVKVKK